MAETCHRTQCIDLGQAAVHPTTPVVAGSLTTITFIYTAGHPVDDSGYVKIAFRYAGDFGTPQFDDPAAPNYCAISTTGNCRIEPRWDPKGHTRPWGRALFLKVRGGFLGRGDQIVVVFGERSGGSPGWQVQTFCEETFEFKTLVDPIATYRFRELLYSPTLRIVPGKPVRAVCIAPSQVMVNQAFAYHLKLEDRWGNPTALPQVQTHPVFPVAGRQTVDAVDAETGLSAESNSIDVLGEDTALHYFWADLHGQSEETIGSNTIEDFFTFARDYALLDIAAHQGNDFQVTDPFWDKVNQVTAAFYEPEAFVTYPGYEWSGNTPLGGDRNVYYSSEGGQIAHSCTDLLPGQRTTHAIAPTATALFAHLGRQHGPRPFAFAHVGGRYADLSVHDPKIELAVEVHSAWGTFEWLVEDALRYGYRIGICANSDGHKGRPGASYPGALKFGSYGGLTCVLAHKLDRESVFKALVARHFYATTGNRMLLQVTLVGDNGQHALMGDVLHTDQDTAHLHVRVLGTAPIESVEVRNGLDRVSTLRPYGEGDLGSRIKVIWRGAEVRGRDRLVDWAGGLQVHGNTILGATPIHFWNPDRPVVSVGRDQLTWESITTGGSAGVILSLEQPDAGALVIDTRQHRVECEIGSIGLAPQIWTCGGLDKAIEVYRLAERSPPRTFAFDLPLIKLRTGDNPIYIRVTQQDGHMAWSSPVYWT
jgi:hypothetical protein